MLKSCITIATLLAAPLLVADAFSVESLNGTVTQSDIDSFKAGIRDLQPPTVVERINWAQGFAGEQLKTFGLGYEISKDVEFLNKMLVFCDTLLSIRNDKSPNGCPIWTGTNDPVWVDCTADVLNGTVYTAGGQGDYIGHLGYSARLILETPSLWDQEVPDLDPFKNGRTYLERAQTYVREADYTVDGHILRSQLDLSIQNRQYFNASDPYKPGLAVPWNQQMMYNYGFSNLALAHELLCTDPERVAKYSALVQTSVDWFFSIVKTYNTTKGNTAYLWTYSVAQPRDIEDNNHAHLDNEGFSRLYALGRYGLTLERLVPFANTIVDNVIRGHRDYAGIIDGRDGSGNGAPTKYLRSGNLLTAEYLPSAFDRYVMDISPQNISRIDVFARLLWLKSRIDWSKTAPL
ncbi:hypothetical protein GGI12_005098 [Dipsacomyces acuminosporus]|nr:hypothetical protein GGI12_005098 [Dipsacomyces acuminosporus]